MRSLAEAAPDSMLALDINHMIYVRGMVSNPQLTDHSVSSEWSPYEGIRIKTSLFLTVPVISGSIPLKATAFHCI